MSADIEPPPYPFTGALPIDSNTAAGCLQMASRLAESRCLEGSIEWLRRSCALDPRNYDARVALGAVYLHLNCLNAAADEFVTAVNLDENGADAHYGLGATWARMGRLQDAISELEHALRLQAAS